MKKTTLAFAWVCLVILAQGCIVIHSEKEMPCPPRTVVSEDSTIRQIDATSKMSFDNDRQRGYKRIARREGLSDAAQVHLVDAVFRHLSFENARVDVLLALVNNPEFSPAAEAAILDRIDRLSFENHKRQVLDAISEREG